MAEYVHDYAMPLLSLAESHMEANARNTKASTPKCRPMEPHGHVAQPHAKGTKCCPQLSYASLHFSYRGWGVAAKKAHVHT